MFATSLAEPLRRAAPSPRIAAAVDAAEHGAKLRATAQESMATMRTMLDQNLVDRVQVDPKGDGSSPEEIKQLTSTLETVRETRRLYESALYERFARLVDSDAADLAPELRRLRAEFIAYALEVERVLIFFGAGTDDDAELVSDLVPDVA